MILFCVTVNGVTDEFESLEAANAYAEEIREAGRYRTITVEARDYEPKSIEEAIHMAIEEMGQVS